MVLVWNHQHPEHTDESASQQWVWCDIMRLGFPTSDFLRGVSDVEVTPHPDPTPQCLYKSVLRGMKERVGEAHWDKLYLRKLMLI